MKIHKRNIVNFFELSEGWQEEARSNLDELAEEAMYIEPDCEYDPNIILWDLTEAMAGKGKYKGFKYNATIGISNNSGMLLNISDCVDEVEYIFV